MVSAYLKRLPAVLALAFCCAAAHAAGAGTSAASFLKIDPSARAAALGGAFTAVAGDPANIGYNPAGIAASEYGKFSFTHNEWIGGLRLESLYVTKNIGKTLTLGVGLNYLLSDSISRTDSTGIMTGGDFTASDGVAAFSIANRFTSNFMAGINAKYIRQTVDTYSGSALAFDGGVLWRYRRFNIGASVSNIGGKMKLYEQSSPLPLTYAFGFTATPWRHLMLSIQADKQNDASLAFRAGTEIAFDNVLFEDSAFALRAGYRSNAPENGGAGLSLGAGLKLRSLSLDYAFIPMGDFGSSSRFTLGLRFGPERKEPYMDPYPNMLRGFMPKDNTTRSGSRYYDSSIR